MAGDLCSDIVKNVSKSYFSVELVSIGVMSLIET